MPARGKGLKIGRRTSSLDKELYEAFKLDSGIEIEYSVFKEIIYAGNKLLHNYILDTVDGFKLPMLMGFLAVTKFKMRSDTETVNWESTNELDNVKHIPFTNFNTYGDIFYIKWFNSGLTNFRNSKVYKFSATREMKRNLCKKIKGGKLYSYFRNKDFTPLNKMEKYYRNYYNLYD